MEDIKAAVSLVIVLVFFTISANQRWSNKYINERTVSQEIAVHEGRPENSRWKMPGDSLKGPKDIGQLDNTDTAIIHSLRRSWDGIDSFTSPHYNSILDQVLDQAHGRQ